MSRPRKRGERYPGGKLKPAKRYKAKVVGHAILGTTAVYVMCIGDRPTKIGISNNPGHRAKNIQVGQDRTVRVFWAVRLARKDALAVERAVHATLKTTPMHLRGEWFMIGGSEAVAVIKDHIRKLRLKDFETEAA
jgi:hypothetical protein